MIQLWRDISFISLLLNSFGSAKKACIYCRNVLSGPSKSACYDNTFISEYEGFHIKIYLTTLQACNHFFLKHSLSGVLNKQKVKSPQFMLREASSQKFYKKISRFKNSSEKKIKFSIQHAIGLKMDSTALSKLPKVLSKRTQS